MQNIMFKLDSPRVSQAFKYRDRMTIITDILKTVKNSSEGRRKTQIMQSANLNYSQVKKYLGYLTDRGLLDVTEMQTYTITNEGSSFLQFIEIQRIHSLR